MHDFARLARAAGLHHATAIQELLSYICQLNINTKLGITQYVNACKITAALLRHGKPLFESVTLAISQTLGINQEHVNLNIPVSMLGRNAPNSDTDRTKVSLAFTNSAYIPVASVIKDAALFFCTQLSTILISFPCVNDIMRLKTVSSQPNHKTATLSWVKESYRNHNADLKQLEACIEVVNTPDTLATIDTYLSWAGRLSPPTIMRELSAFGLPQYFLSTVLNPVLELLQEWMKLNKSGHTLTSSPISDVLSSTLLDMRLAWTTCMHCANEINENCRGTLAKAHRTSLAACLTGLMHMLKTRECILHMIIQKLAPHDMHLSKLPWIVENYLFTVKALTRSKLSHPAIAYLDQLFAAVDEQMLAGFRQLSVNSSCENPLLPWVFTKAALLRHRLGSIVEDAGDVQFFTSSSINTGSYDQLPTNMFLTCSRSEAFLSTWLDTFNALQNALETVGISKQNMLPNLLSLADKLQSEFHMTSNSVMWPSLFELCMIEPYHSRRCFQLSECLTQASQEVNAVSTASARTSDCTFLLKHVWHTDLAFNVSSEDRAILVDALATLPSVDRQDPAIFETFDPFFRDALLEKMVTVTKKIPEGMDSSAHDSARNSMIDTLEQVVTAILERTQIKTKLSTFCDGNESCEENICDKRSTTSDLLSEHGVSQQEEKSTETYHRCFEVQLWPLRDALTARQCQFALARLLVSLRTCTFWDQLSSESSSEVTVHTTIFSHSVPKPESVIASVLDICEKNTGPSSSIKLASSLKQFSWLFHLLKEKNGTETRLVRLVRGSLVRIFGESFHSLFNSTTQRMPGADAPLPPFSLTKGSCSGLDLFGINQFEDSCTGDDSTSSNHPTSIKERTIPTDETSTDQWIVTLASSCFFSSFMTAYIPWLTNSHAVPLDACEEKLRQLKCLHTIVSTTEEPPSQTQAAFADAFLCEGFRAWVFSLASSVSVDLADVIGDTAKSIHAMISKPLLSCLNDIDILAPNTTAKIFGAKSGSGSDEHDVKIPPLATVAHMWVHLGCLMFGMAKPRSSVDKGIHPVLQLSNLSWIFRFLQAKHNAQEVFGDAFTDKMETKAMDAAQTHEWINIALKEAQACLKRTVFRPPEQPFVELHKEIMVMYETLENGHKPVVLASELQAALSDTSAQPSALALSRLIQQCHHLRIVLNQIVRRCRTVYTGFPDILEPICCSLYMMLHGIVQLEHELKCKHDVLTGSCASRKAVTSTVLHLSSHILLSGPVQHMLSQLTSIEYITSLVPNAHGQSRASIERLGLRTALLTTRTVLTRDWNTACQSKHPLTTQIQIIPCQSPHLDKMLGVFNAICTRWNDTMRRRAEILSEKEQTFKYREKKHDILCDDEHAEHELRQMFPTYFRDFADLDDGSFTEILGSDGDQDNISSQFGGTKNLDSDIDQNVFDVVDENLMRETVHTHKQIFTMGYLYASTVDMHTSLLKSQRLTGDSELRHELREREARFVRTCQPDILDHLELLQTRRALAVELSTQNHHRAGDVDAILWPVHAIDLGYKIKTISGQHVGLSSLDPQAECIQGTHSTPVFYDFYRDPNPAEAISVRPVLSNFIKRLKSLLSEWTENPVLVHLAALARRILEFPLSSPLPRILTGLDLILKRAIDWEQVASSTVSLRDELDDISALVIRWRQLELQYWPRLLPAVWQQFSDLAASRWFELYGMLTSLPKELLRCLQNGPSLQRVSNNFGNDVELQPDSMQLEHARFACAKHVYSVTQTLVAFMTDSCNLGEFIHRLDLLWSFAGQIQSALQSAEDAIGVTHIDLYGQSGRDKYYSSSGAAVGPYFLIRMAAKGNHRQETTKSTIISKFYPIVSSQEIYIEYLGAMHSSLYNLCQYYAQFVPSVELQIRTRRLELEKDVRNFIKLIRWKDTNYATMKETADKTHRAIHKFIRAYKEILFEPVNDIFEQAPIGLEFLDSSYAMSALNEHSNKISMQAYKLAVHHGENLDSADFASNKLYQLEMQQLLSRISSSEEDMAILLAIEDTTLKASRLVRKKVLLPARAQAVDAMDQLSSNVVERIQSLQQWDRDTVREQQEALQNKQLKDAELEERRTKRIRQGNYGGDGDEEEQAKAVQEQFELDKKTKARMRQLGKSMKQGALADLLTALRKAGLSFSSGSVRGQQAWETWIETNPLPRATACWSSMDELESKHGAIIAGVQRSAEFFYRIVARLQGMQTASSAPHKDVQLKDVPKCRGFALDLFRILLQQRRELQRMLNNYDFLHRILDQITDCSRVHGNNAKNCNVEDNNINDSNLHSKAVPQNACLDDSGNKQNNKIPHNICILLEPKDAYNLLNPIREAYHGLCDFICQVNSLVSSNSVQISNEVVIALESIASQIDDSLRKSYSFINDRQLPGVLSNVASDVSSLLPNTNQFNKSSFSSKSTTMGFLTGDTFLSATDLCCRLITDAAAHSSALSENPLLSRATQDVLSILIKAPQLVEVRLKDLQLSIDDRDRTSVGKVFALEPSLAEAIVDFVKEVLLSIQNGVQTVGSVLGTPLNTRDNQAYRPSERVNSDSAETHNIFPNHLIVTECEIRTSFNALRSERIIERYVHLFEVASSVRTKTPVDFACTYSAISSCLQMYHPLVKQYVHAVEALVADYVALHKASSKLEYVLSGLFKDLFVRGFCVPSELEEEGSDEGHEGMELDGTGWI